jgi:hypothetical protein
MLFSSYVPPAPGPSPEVETTLRETLVKLDPLLSVRWVAHAAFNRQHQRFEGRYALTCRWPMADKRWKEVHEGRHPEYEACDIVGWLCEDMSDPESLPTSPDGITDRVLALLGTMDNTRYPWKDRMMRTVRKNAKVHETLKNDVLDLTHGVAEYYYRQAKGVPQSTGADFSTPGVTNGNAA